jgi:hypothetical protein
MKPHLPILKPTDESILVEYEKEDLSPIHDEAGRGRVVSTSVR